MSKKLKIRRNVLILLIFIFFSLFLIASNAFIIKDSYKIVGVILTGGATLQGGSYKSKIYVGLPVIGTVSENNYKICFGIFCVSNAIQSYDFNFTGKLNYSNGSAVAYTPIEITVNYLGEKFKGSGMTDSSGSFIVKIRDTPSYIVEKDLNVTMHVYDEIEAIYECWYNHTSENCCPHKTIGLIPC